MINSGTDAGLEKYYLNDAEWDLLQDFADILEVFFSSLFILISDLHST